MSELLLSVSGSPHVHHSDSVKKMMWSVVIALIPAFLVSIYYFGINVVIITAISILCCLLFEYLIQRFLLKVKPTISDGSAAITGLLLAFNVPSNLPLWMVAIGALVAIGIGKMAFGGLGKNPFNPALAGRVFLLISFPVAMTSWPSPTPIGQVADALTGPTPLGILKEGVAAAIPVSEIMVSPNMPDYVEMLMGQMGGSFGEVSAIALLIGAIFLFIRKIITWHIPVSFILTVFVFAGIFHLINPEVYVNPFFHLVTGGLLLGAFFMATDMVTSPTSRMGMIVFGVGCGLLTIIIRMFGSYPEGASFAILLMNAVTPLINKGCKPKAFAK
ncbi:MAG: RnfABCDGE type electron transport complex subunit D [Bacteroidales bacterium]|jgi:electron transport complex protein RnfD|nr:RnfABCDGE type electron transport complex subunit D [Bacteroidales bacterium]